MARQYESYYWITVKSNKTGLFIGKNRGGQANK